MNDFFPILAYLIEELRAEQNRVQLLYDISARLNSNLELPQALRSILSVSVAGVTDRQGGTRGSILLLDDSAHPSDWIIMRELPREEQAALIEAALHSGLWGWII